MSARSDMRRAILRTRDEMDTIQITQVSVMKTGMLIHKPVAEVFEAFSDPDITTQFWFTRSSGRLATSA